MLRHPGHRRTFSHNIRLAALLCLTAGFVNVTGFRALFAEQLAEGNFSSALTVGLWMLLFFLGAFTCSLWIHRVRWKRYAYSVPILTEVLILITVAVAADWFSHKNIGVSVSAGALLFAMGVQNAMVSVISGATVRTTHLTGMFTDLGIELSAIGIASSEEKKVYRQKITLRIVIISFFLLGGIAGGFLFGLMSYSTFYIPAVILVIALGYDVFRVKLLRQWSKTRNRRRS